VTPNTDVSDECTDEFTYFGDTSDGSGGLLEDLFENSGSYSGNGTIYVAWDYDYTLETVGTVTLDKAVLSALNELTIQGGWNFTNDALDTLNPYSYLGDISLTITNWGDDVFVNNIWIAESDYGLDIDTSDNISLNAVDVEKTVFGNGIDLQAEGNVTAEDVFADANDYHGMEVDAGGDVEVTLSDFNNNGYMGSGYDDEDYISGSGLVIYAGGDVTLVNVIAGDNANHGARIGGSYDSDVTITGGEYNYNGDYGSLYWYVDGETHYWSAGGDGIRVNTGGHVELTNVEANENALHGVEVVSAAFDSVTVNGGVFNENGWFGSEYFDAPCNGPGTYCYEFMYGNGLNLHSNGFVTLNGVVADSNYGSGAYLVSMDGGNVNVNNSGFDSNGQGVYYYGEGNEFSEYVCYEFGLCETLLEMPRSYLYSDGYYGESGFSLWFEFDAGDGLFASTSGDVNLAGVSANNNSGDGAHLSDNDYQFDDYHSLDNVVVNNSEFNGNGFYSGEGEPDLPLGLEGYLFFAGDTSECEDFEDCLEFASGSISGESGLQAYAFFDITLNNVVANENALHGAELENYAETSVFINHSHFEGNGDGFPSFYFYFGDGEYLDGTYGSGAYIDSTGNATLNCNQFIDNANYGADGENVNGIFASNSDTYSGNGSGDTNGSPVFGSTDCDPDDDGGGGGGGTTLIVPVTGGVGFPIDCNNPEVFEALLENGDKALFELLCDYDGMLLEEPLTELPDEIPSEYEYIAGMDITVLLDGGVVVPLPAGASVTPSFEVEDEDAEYAILYWNGSEWEELEGGELNEDGFFSAKVEFTGTFVLVTK
jgi:hypothetical protein